MFPANENGPSAYTPLTAQGHPLLPVEGALLSVLPSTPEHRRKPILAVLDLLQRRYNLHGIGDEEEATNNSFVCESPNPDTDQKKSENSKENTTRIDTKTGNFLKAHQVNRIYALLDTLMKDHPDTNDGFSYAFKYQVPPASSKLDNVEVSVQQSLQRFPQIEDDPLPNRVFKTPLDYMKVQDKLDAVLEDSVQSEMPVHLNTPGVFGPLLLSQYSHQHKEQRAAERSKDRRKEDMEDERVLRPTKLMLRPLAKAVAGPRGIAVASPMARAVLRRGQPVSLEYEPDAVAIAGPGGRAHSHPELSIDYIESEESKQ